MADMQLLMWVAKLVCLLLSMQITFLSSPATAGRQRTPPSPAVRVATINLTHITQIYTTGCSPGTVNVTVGTQRTTPVPFYLFTPSAQAHQHLDEGKLLPAVYFLNGFNVPAQYYSNLATLLAASGFHVATSEYRRDTVFTQPGIDPSCKPYVFTSAATINTLMDAQPVAATGGSSAKALQVYRSHARQHGIVLLAHSLGGNAALDVLVPGRCNRFAYDAVFADWCQQYYPMTRGSAGADLIRGTFSWEGYIADVPSVSAPLAVTLPADKFVVYLQGQFNSMVRAAANDTRGSKCVHWIKMKGNHYGMNNINPASGGPLATDLVSQQPPCGAKAEADPENFKLPRSLQQKIVADLAAIITTMTRAILRLPGGGGRRKVAQLLAASTSVLNSTLNAACFR